MLPTGFDRLSANAPRNDDNNDANQDPTSLEVGKKINGITSPNFSITVTRDFMRCKHGATKPNPL